MRYDGRLSAHYGALLDTGWYFGGGGGGAAVAFAQTRIFICLALTLLTDGWAFFPLPPGGSNSPFGHFHSSAVESADWPQLPIGPVNAHSGNDLEPRKQEFQHSLVETTFDLTALTSALRQVEAVS